MIKEINLLLDKPCEFIDFENPQIDVIQLAHDMAETMMSNKTMALAANEIGLPYNMISLLSNPIIVLVNPIFVDHSETETLMEEGSVTHPGLIVKVKRKDWIRVRFKRPNGEVVTEKFEGMTSRLIQQKVDILYGKLYYNQASKFHRDQAMRRWKK